MTKPDSPSGRFNGRSGVTSSVSQQQQMVGGSGSGGGAYPGKFSGSTPVSSGGSIPSSSIPNAWGTKKEAVSVVEPVNHSNWSGPNAVSRFAQASALEKVSSGRWQTKPPVIHQPDVEVISFSDDSDFRSAKDNYLYNEVDLMNEKADFDIMRGRYGEKSQIVEDEISGAGGKGYLYQERARSPMYSEAKERNLAFHRDVVRPTSTDGKLGGSFTQPPMPAEVVERPKIKLLPRSKPLDNSEALIVDYTQGHQPPSHSTHVETSHEGYGNEIISKPGSATSEGDKRVVERPRLNLKPRSQPLEQADAIAERERKALFGDARPRELVLKERGVDDVVINNLDVMQPPNRTPKTETKPETVNATPVYVDRAEKFLHDQKSGKNFDRKDHRTNFDKNEQRGSWRNENWRNSRETEKQQQQERRPEPETWRKPVEEPNSPPSDAAGLRYGKAASALELAQAFSRSNSGPKTVERLSGQRGLPGRNQIPFSRLTETREFYSGSTPRRQINGY
ncbi:eukaryotic translation initiation factor-like protein [Thalictrum thalictroides]|uniref:Eukaryotic translation initiation factor-like protein n=1 Tax=Thalictrum thalictroides TaxID=46969 RepID=A0A7J6WXY5_THATH|nr:eukaryotic translation initiation factor-like protein [Thalictrum thalictroides]